MNNSQRKHHFINGALQNRLIFSLVIFELLLISCAVYFVYQDMTQVIEDNMFRSHIQNSLSLEYFAGRVLQAMMVLLIVNLVVASAIVWRWRHYVNGIVEPLQKMIASIHQLDFRNKIEQPALHEAVVITQQWQLREKQRFYAIRQHLAELSVDEAADLTEKLQHCRQLIGNNSSD
ncbi:MAG: hypothetical protein OEY36_03515 [Gammaproteobacteria bacterium]|nr:hypothetical protein [Gammaproteobacteria bacterium]